MTKFLPIFLYENCCILIILSRKHFTNGQINLKLALDQNMAGIDKATRHYRDQWGGCLSPHIWPSYQIRKITGCAWAGNAGNVFPAANFKGTASDPDMHHDTCRDGFRDSGVENVPGIPGECATHNFTYLARGPCVKRSRLDTLSKHYDMITLPLQRGDTEVQSIVIRLLKF